MHKSDVTIDLSTNSIEIHDSQAEPWKVTLVDTGNDTLTGGRIKRIKEHVNNETFMLTYGDGVSDVDINELLKFHKIHGKYCTVTSVQPSGRFGALDIDVNNEVKSFIEKPRGDGAWVNGGFFICEPAIFNYIDGDTTVWEKEPMETIANQGQMLTYKHHGFWKPMDTLRDKQELEHDWVIGQAKWKVW